jgi:hypothetical protein
MILAILYIIGFLHLKIAVLTGMGKLVLCAPVKRVDLGD